MAETMPFHIGTVMVRTLADKSVRPTWFVVKAGKADSSVSLGMTSCLGVGPGDTVAPPRSSLPGSRHPSEPIGTAEAVPFQIRASAGGRSANACGKVHRSFASLRMTSHFMKAFVVVPLEDEIAAAYLPCNSVRPFCWTSSQEIVFTLPD
jgi:hypothetical protein